jgi:hypothetical protein
MDELDPTAHHEDMGKTPVAQSRSESHHAQKTDGIFSR